MIMENTFAIGNPYPLGVSIYGKVINIAVVMHPKQEGGILFYGKKDRKDVKKLVFTQQQAVGDIYSVTLPISYAKQYDYLFFEDEHIFLDPFAKKIIGNEKWHPYEKGYDEKNKVKLLGGFLEDRYSWEKDRKLHIPYEESFIYCMHVRGFTKHVSSKVKGKGTFLGITEKIPYLKELSVTAIELMPCYEFLEDTISTDMIGNQTKGSLISQSMDYAIRNYKNPISPDHPQVTFNYWGYQEGYYYAPKASYAYSSNPVTEFKDMVCKLHQNGIEVIMQFYFPKNTPASDILEILRHWVCQYHVDGFRLKGVDIPFYLIAKDPIFTYTKLMYDDVPENILYPDRKVPAYKNVAYCSDDFSTICRRFLKGDNDCLYQFQNLNRIVPECIGVVRSITNYYGFRLMDLVSYEQKHNEANGEDNLDGVNYNFSWNCGAEGKTRKKSIQDLRMKLMKNALCMLFLSQGTPFIMSGDEFAKSQLGNNNPYNQDNEISWLNWNLSVYQKELLEFTKQLLAFRKNCKSLHRGGKFSPIDVHQCGFPEISLHTEELWKVDMADYRHHIGILYVDDSKEYTYVLYNMHWNEHRFALPTLQKGMKWEVSLFTDHAKKQVEIEKMLVSTKDAQPLFVDVPERSVLVLKAK